MRGRNAVPCTRGRKAGIHCTKSPLAGINLITRGRKAGIHCTEGSYFCILG